MLETIVARQVIFYFVGAIIAIGIIAKIIAGISLKRLVKAASNMGKSNHGLMRLVRAKFEHACMVSDRVQNIGAFVDKYVYEYKALGIRLHSWRQLEKAMIWLCVLASAAGAGLTYYVEGMNDIVYRYGIVGGAGAVVLLLLHIMTDDKYQMDVAKTYMVDFLENTYAHRYAKSNQKEIQVTVQRAADEDGQAGGREMPPIEEPQEDDIPPVEEPIIPPEKDPMQDPIPRPIPQQAPMPVARQEEVDRTGKSRIAGRKQNVRANQEARAASSGYVQSSGVPQNGGVYAGQVNDLWRGPGEYQNSPGYQNMAGSNDTRRNEEQDKQEFQREARIREILEEFLA